ncbi:MAG: sigma-70 family RNA polymerase sigma factor [Synergistaceae bacterium]|jgi:RNA polymerase sporulation-specific sigma factor|nr:sigma-70 family RNA polymerase sigma factor [Synergistaceae bacterium]
MVERDCGIARIASEMGSFLPVVMSEARKLSGGDLFTREDLVQEGFIAALHALDTYDPKRGSIEGYVRTCARNRMISYLRRSWHESLIDSDALNERAPVPPPIGGGSQERIEIGEALSNLLKSLSQFEAIVLHAYLRGGSVSSAALLLQCDRKRVDNALQRIRNKARAMQDEDENVDGETASRCASESRQQT